MTSFNDILNDRPISRPQDRDNNGVANFSAESMTSINTGSRQQVNAELPNGFPSVAIDDRGAGFPRSGQGGGFPDVDPGFGRPGSDSGFPDQDPGFRRPGSDSGFPDQDPGFHEWGRGNGFPPEGAGDHPMMPSGQTGIDRHPDFPCQPANQGEIPFQPPPDDLPGNGPWTRNGGDAGRIGDSIANASAVAITDAIKTNNPDELRDAIKNLPQDGDSLQNVAAQINSQFKGDNIASVNMGTDGTPTLTLSENQQPFAYSIEMTPGDPDNVRVKEYVNGFVPKPPTDISLNAGMKAISEIV